MITAAETCDFINEVVCKPANVKELFEFANFGSSQISRTEVLILLAGLIPVALMYFGLRKKSTVPGKLQSVVESIFSFVKDEIAVGVIGRGGEKFTPYLISIFMFSSTTGYIQILAKLVCLLAPESNGDILTSLCMPDSFFNHPNT